jgi:hypothetical protein
MIREHASHAGYDFTQADNLEEYDGFAENLVSRRYFINPTASHYVRVISY